MRYALKILNAKIAGVDNLKQAPEEASHVNLLIFAAALSIKFYYKF